MRGGWADGVGCVWVWWVGGRQKRKVRTVRVSGCVGDGTTQNRAAHDNARKQPCERGGRGGGVWVQGGKKKVYRSSDPCALGPRRYVWDGDLLLLLLLLACCAAARVCGLCVGVCICAPGFSMCRGGEGASCLFSWVVAFLPGRAGQGKGYLGTCLLLSVSCFLRRCCAAVPLEAGTLGHTPAGQWCGVADGGGGGDLLRPAWMGMESGQGDLD